MLEVHLEQRWATAHVLRTIDHDNVCIFDFGDPDDCDVFDGGWRRAGNGDSSPRADGRLGRPSML
jgi:hypothetical protein